MYFSNNFKKIFHNSVTSLLLLAVFNNAGGVDKGDPLKEFVGHLNANKLLQEVLSKLLQRRERA